MEKNNWKDIGIISLMIFMLLIVAGISLSFINMSINDGSSNQNSDKGLICKLTINQTSNVNITWYKDGIENITSTINCIADQDCATPGNSSVPNTYTQKGQTWICKAEFIDNGNLIISNVSAFIVDTPPYQPRIFYATNNSEIFNETIIINEDSSLAFNVSSSDWDNDTITYILDENPDFCTVNAVSGYLNCSPSLESDVNSWIFSVGAKTTQPDYAVIAKTFRLNVTPTNDAPEFLSLQDQNLTEGQVLNYVITGTDDENNFPLNLSVNVSPSTINLTINRINNVSFMITLNDNRTATFGETSSNYTVTAYLNDSNNIQSKQTVGSFKLLGVSRNHLPNISYKIYNSIGLMQGGSLSVYINATDLDNNTLNIIPPINPLYPISYSSATDYNTTVANASFFYAWINISNLTNEYVISHNFTSFISDGNEYSNATINMFIANTNDAPIIHDISTITNASGTPSNTLNNTNLSRLIAYTNIPIRYQVNATDADSQTYDYQNTGIHNFSTNDSRFTINSNTGVLNFSHNASGNFSFKVTVRDKGSLTFNYTANVEILPNTNPQFSLNPITIYCNEYDSTNWQQNCTYNIGDNVTEIDADDSITLYSTNSTVFDINGTTGVINFEADQLDIGNYTIEINVTDSRGGVSEAVINLIINNTNNAPIMLTPNVQNDFMLVGTPYQITYDVIDNDLNLLNTTENLTFSINATGPDVTLFNLSKVNSTRAILWIRPMNASFEGSYNVNVTTTDSSGNFSSRALDIYIYNVTSAPTISQIKPFGTPINNGSITDDWSNITNFQNMTTNITIYENQTFIFNQTSFADNSSYSNNLTYEWYYDGVLDSSNNYFEKDFNFFSSGNHNLTFIARDSYNSTNSFNWKIQVINVNRAPTYTNNSLENKTITASQVIPNYLTYSDGGVMGNDRRRFYDPDDDVLGLGYSTDYTSNLTFSSTSCSYATFTFDALHRLRVETISVGECLIIFTATDEFNLSISSEAVHFNITNVTTSDPEPIVIPSTSSSSSQNKPVPIPLPQEIERPKPLQIITPKLVTIYKNGTIKIPVVLNNTWNGTLVGITLEAVTNASNVTLYLDKIYFTKLSQGESTEALLYVKNYKSEGHYEIQLIANVTSPTYRDVATIFINSAEMKSEGEELENKISFARDLLSSNPECQELNELLVQAQKELEKENYAVTTKIVDDVLNGCKYLVNAKKQEQAPSKDFVKTFEWKKSFNDYVIIGLFAMLFLASLYYILKKDYPESNF